VLEPVREPKILGVIGGVGPESTIDYYRALIDTFRQCRPGEGYPPMIINSVDLDRLRGWMEAADYPPVVDYLTQELSRLARAGADFALLSANSPHIVFEELRELSPLPLISIVEATRNAAQQLGLTRLALIGTRFTMQGHFYPQVFDKAGVGLIVPSAEEQDFIHNKYFDELVVGKFLPETRQQFCDILQAMKRRDGIDGVILGGTELPLILTGEQIDGLPLLDTTRIHVNAAIEFMLA
jgi:aspartate racemase